MELVKQWHHHIIASVNGQELQLLLEAREAARGSGAKLRESAGLSQAEIARVARVSMASVSRWEAGKRRPTGDAAIRYAKTLRSIRRRLAAA